MLIKKKKLRKLQGLVMNNKMTEVKILILGYAKKIKDGWLASSTVTFIESNQKKIIIDPGCNRKKLLEELSKNNLKIEDIDFVILTHNHIDHILLAGIFKNAKILDNSEIYTNDKQIGHNNKIPGTDIEIIESPGHDMFHCSVLVNDEKFGKVVVGGDLFWWEDNEEQKTDKESLIKHNDPYVKNEEESINSRKKILEIADYIIPGHGEMFKVIK